MSEYHLALKDYPQNLQPRERLVNHGSEALSDIELLALLLSTGTQKKTALDLAREILLELPEKNLSALAKLGLADLTKLSGLGQAKASRILAALELGRRMALAEMPAQPTLNCPDLVAAWLRPYFAHLEQEHFLVLFLDSKQRVVGQKVIHLGTLNAALVHPRDVFREAVKNNAHGLILAHNHPSGDPEPSEADLYTTRQLIKCGKMMQIEVQDHIILGRQNYYSMRERLPLWLEHESKFFE